MKSLIFTLTLLLLCGSTFSYDPPKSLEWGMSYLDIEQKLSAEHGIKVKGLSQKNPGKGYKEYPELQLPDGYFRSEAKKVKLLKKKTQRTYTIYDQDTSLAAFHYILKWDNDKSNKGMRKSWVYHSDIKAALIRKYGEPIEDEVTELIRAVDMPSGTKYVTRWEDEDGSQIYLEITRQTHNLIIGKVDAYLIFVLYFSPSMDPQEPRLPIEEDEI